MNEMLMANGSLGTIGKYNCYCNSNGNCKPYDPFILTLFIASSGSQKEIE